MLAVWSIAPSRDREVHHGNGRDCHRNFGPENLGPGGPKFPTNLGPAGPILPEIMVRVGNIGPLTGVYMYGPKFPAVSFTGNNGVCLGQCKYMQVIEYILHTKPE